MAVNIRLLRVELQRQSDVVLKQVKPLMQREFEKARVDMMDAFDDNDVTEEIAGGPEADSKYIFTAATEDHNTGGNLYSFLGFSSYEDPTKQLRNIVYNSVKLDLASIRKTDTDKGFLFEAQVKIDNIDTINTKVARATPLDWTSKAWTALLEQGIPWFSHYLFDNTRPIKSSRSGTAIQVKGNIRQGRANSVPGIKYVSKIIQAFKDSLSKIKIRKRL